VGRRVLPGILAVVAAFADTHGSHGLAFDLLLAAIPFTAVAALISFGTYLEDRASSIAGLQSLLWTLALALLVLSCAARSPASTTDTLPPLGWSALVGCLGIFAIKAVVAVAPQLRRLGYHAAKP
jgi:uncharacterized membrane protein HdeD (DUF308 family)